MKRLYLLIALVLIPASLEAQIFRKINQNVIIPLNRMALTADGQAIDTGFTYNDAGISLTAACTPKGAGTGNPTFTSITPTTAGDYDLTHGAAGLYQQEIPADGASFDNDKPQWCYFSLEADSILIASSPLIDFDFAYNLEADERGADRRGLHRRLAGHNRHRTRRHLWRRRIHRPRAGLPR